MSDLIKYGAIAVGGYFVLRYLGYDLLNLNPVSTAAVTTTGTTVDPGAVISAQTTKQKVSDLAKANGWNPTSTYYSVDTWNYLYNQVRGIPGPAPETLFPNANRNKAYSLDEWWAAMTGAGFSGLGVIANHVNPYWDRPTNMRQGQNLNPTGMEKYIVRFTN